MLTKPVIAIKHLIFIIILYIASYTYSHALTFTVTKPAMASTHATCRHGEHACI